MTRTEKYKVERKMLKADSDAILGLLQEILNNIDLILINLDKMRIDQLDSFDEECKRKIGEVFEIGCE